MLLSAYRAVHVRLVRVDCRRHLCNSIQRTWFVIRCTTLNHSHHLHKFRTCHLQSRMLLLILELTSSCQPTADTAIKQQQQATQPSSNTAIKQHSHQATQPSSNTAIKQHSHQATQPSRNSSKQTTHQATQPSSNTAIKQHSHPATQPSTIQQLLIPVDTERSSKVRRVRPRGEVCGQVVVCAAKWWCVLPSGGVCGQVVVFAAKWWCLRPSAGSPQRIQSRACSSPRENCPWIHRTQRSRRSFRAT